VIEYSWTFRADTGVADQTDGGSDLMERIAFTVG
jgi:hypothetical protein